MPALKSIATDKAPAAVGHYSQAIQAGNFLFLSGQIPLDPTTNEVIKGNVAQQTERVMKNIEAILTSQGLNLHHIVKATVFLKDIKTFAAFNEVYAEMLGKHKPARSAVEVSNLPKGVDIEIEVIVALS